MNQIKRFNYPSPTHSQRTQALILSAVLSTCFLEGALSSLSNTVKLFEADCLQPFSLSGTSGSSCLQPPPCIFENDNQPNLYTCNNFKHAEIQES